MRAAAAIAAALAIAAGFTIARPAAGSGPSLRDFEAYYSAGATLRRGNNPYSTEIWQTEKMLPGVIAARNEVLPFAGPPATLPFWRALSVLPFATASQLWRALLLLSIAALLWCVREAAMPAAATVSLRSWPEWLALICLGASFGPLTNALALGQIALPVCAAAAIAVCARSRTLKTAATFVACAQPNLALGVLGALRKRRNVVPIAIGGLAFVATSIAMWPPGGYTAALALHAAAERFAAIQVTPGAIAYGFGASSSAATAIGVVSALLAIVAWLFWARKTGSALALFCLTCALAPFAAGFFHEHDLSLLFLPAVVLAVRSGARCRWLAAAGAMLCAENWLGLAQQPYAWMQSFILLAAFALALTAIGQDFDLKSAAAAFGALVLLVVMHPIASAHPLPQWPDAMRTAPSLALSTVAAVWHAEQAASGLFARDSVWAFLRLLPLAGCALIAYGAALSLRSLGDSRT